MKDSGIAIIFKSKNTVFTSRDLAILWGINNYGYLRSRIEYYIKNGYLYRIYHGLYAKDRNNFNLFEAANKLRVPSYISLESVLASESVIFQKYSSVFLVSYAPKTIKIAHSEFVYKKIKDIILFNPAGIINKESYFIASKERAFLDALYLYKNYHFDNLRQIDWNKVEELLPVYNTAALNKRVKEYRKNAGSK
ncbi:MAG: hypothetical protein ABIH00_06435 [Armatimonadota bacterium]